MLNFPTNYSFKKVADKMLNPTLAVFSFTYRLDSEISVIQPQNANSRFCLRTDSAQPLNLSRMLIEQRLMRWLAPCRYRLLEALAEHLIQNMCAEWHCKRIVLEIEKPGALGELARVGVRITRHV